jgi:hypothetical protein
VSKTTSDGVVPLIINGSFVRSVEKLADDIAVFHGLNFSEVEQDINRFFNSVQTTNLDVASVQKSIADFRRIENLKEYHPLKIDFEDPYSISNATTALGLILTLLCGFLFLYCTCKCCACCKPILDLSTFVFKGI